MHWLRGFLRRHPQRAKGVAEGKSRARAAVTEDSIRSWFAKLKVFVKNNGLDDVITDPRRVINGDETAIPTGNGECQCRTCFSQKGFVGNIAGSDITLRRIIKKIIT